MDSHQIIIKPVLTEKTNWLREEDPKRYVFRVHSQANKQQVIQAVEDLFGVRPAGCNTMNVKGKAASVVSRTGHRGGRGSHSSWRKAVVTMAAGDKIEAFEGA